MKNIFKKLASKKLFAIGTVVAVALTLGTSAIASFGPDRPTRAWSVNENGFDYVTYNSYTGVPGIGDERDFLRGVVVGRDSQWADPVADVANDEKVQAKVYIHNNADPLLNDAAGNPGVAKNVNVKIEIPTGLKPDHEVKATISAANAQPVSVFDSLDISGVNDSLFQLTYVPGSAKLGGQVLSDDIFTKGISIGDQKGCFEFLKEITFEMKIEKPGYQIQKTARIKGEDSTKWRKVVNAKIGDEIEWKIYFENTGSTRLDDVIVVDNMPSFTSIVPGSIELFNVNFANGYKVSDEAIQDNGDTVNLNIEDYGPTANAYLYINSKIEDNATLRCGVHQLANVVYVTPKGLSTLNDNAKINIINEPCAEPIETACVNLTAPKLQLKSGESTVLTANATAKGDTLQGFIFNVNGQTVQDSASATYTFNATTEGVQTVTATAKFASGNKTSAACTKQITVTKKPINTVCTALTGPVATLKTGEKTTLTATASAEGDTLLGFIFRVNGQVVQDSDKSTYEFSRNEEGSFKIAAEAKFATGNKTSANCEKTITVSKVVVPVYTCEDFKFTFVDRTGTASFLPKASNGATFKDATIIFSADGTKKFETTTNKLTAAGRIEVANKFNDTDVNVYAKATVRFNIPEGNTVKVVEVACQGNAVLAKVTPEAPKPVTPTVIPNTGAGSIAGILVAVTAAGAIAHRAYALKRQ